MTDTTATHPHYLFVYGTLKAPFGNNALLVKHGSKFVAEARTMDKYTLTHGFPFVHRPNGAAALGYYKDHLGHVVGELWKVTDAGLEACDRLEGHPKFYCRTPTTVEFGPPAQVKRVTAGMYISGDLGPPLGSLEKPREDGSIEWGTKRNPRLESMSAQFRRKA